MVPLARFIKPVWLVTGGLLLNAVGYAVVALLNPPPIAVLIIAFAVLGMGVGAAETISNDLILASAPAEKAGAASAISETAYELGSVLGTAILGSVLAAVYRAQLQLPAGLDGAAIQKAEGTLGGALEVAGQQSPGVGEALRESAMSAFDSGAVVTSTVGFILMLAAAALAIVTLRKAKAS